jgi:hypothetical protein
MEFPTVQTDNLSHVEAFHSRETKTSVIGKEVEERTPQGILGLG